MRLTRTIEPDPALEANPKNKLRYLEVTDSTVEGRASLLTVHVIPKEGARINVAIGLTEAETLELIDALQLQLMEWRARR